jgi:hypothetical protein
LKAKKLNKKSPCSCGSGKRYEQCCRRKNLAARRAKGTRSLEGEERKKFIQKAKEIFRQKDEKRKKFVEQFGHIRVPQMIKMPGGAVILIGGSMYKQTRPGNYNFVNAVYDHALDFFGVPYLEEQEKKPLHLRHPALQWMYNWVEQSQANEATRTGAAAAWIRFAYDLYTIRDNANLEKIMKDRLLDFERFQGARHELWTAALFIAANFEINFENETDNLKKHPEFVAIDRETSVKIAVEAKSRHRRGVKGFSGGSQKPPGEEVGVRGLVVDAFQKESDLPLYVVVDVNLPPQSLDYRLESWYQELDNMMEDLSLEGYADPCPANAILFHNDPSHYLINEQTGSESDALWIKDYFLKNPRTPNKFMSIIHDRILKAFHQRLTPPAEIPEI